MTEDSVLAAASEFKPKSRLPIIVTGISAFVAGALLGALVTAATVSSDGKGKGKTKGKPEKSAPAASVAASASGSAPAGDAGAPPPKKGSLAARAIGGDAKAVEELEKKAPSERSFEEAIALSKGRTELKRKELAEIGRKVTLVPKLVKEDKDVANRLKELTNDREVSLDALKTLAEMPAPTGPDLLYNVISSSWKETDTTRQAEELLYSKEVRAKASPALAVVLDLRKVEKCEEAQKILERVKKEGDRRAFTPLMRLHNKRGCGEKKTEDCFPCIREGDLLKDATMEAQKRAGP